MKLTDLRVAKAEPSRMNLRFATPADILEVAATLPGAERQWVCERGTAYYGPCEPGTRTLLNSYGEDVTDFYAHRHTDCGWRLVIPLEET